MQIAISVNGQTVFYDLDDFEVGRILRAKDAEEMRPQDQAAEVAQFALDAVIKGIESA